jgi:acetyltransferase
MPNNGPSSFPKSEVNFSPLFSPKTIAIVGASKNKIGGSKFYFAQKSSGFIKDGGKVYLINPKFTELFGERVYPSILDPDLPKPIDLVIIAVPARFVSQIVKECHTVAKFGIIYTSGFGEAFNTILEKELKDSLSHVDTRFIGPNCLGVLNPYAKLMIYPEWGHYKGNISYISQSGGTMARLYLMLGSIGLGFSNVVSIGNSYDIQVTELMHYFGAEPKTTTIALYLESLSNGREFMQLARKITPEKPIVLWKGGQSARGVLATISHTGGLAGSYTIWEAMCRQSGILLADHFELFMDMVQVANIQPLLPKSLNVAVLVAGGGIGVEFTDRFEQEGLTVPELASETVKKLEQIFPGVNTSFKNPVDLGEYGYNPPYFAQALEIVLDDPNIDSVVFVREPERFKIIGQMLGIADTQATTIQTIWEVVQNSTSGKPIYCNSSQNKDSEEAYSVRHDFQIKMVEAGIPVINIMSNIPKIIRQFYYYGQFLNSEKA